MLQTDITKQYRVIIRNNFTLFIKMKTNTLVIFTNVSYALIHTNQEETFKVRFVYILHARGIRGGA